MIYYQDLKKSLYAFDDGLSPIVLADAVANAEVTHKTTLTPITAAQYASAIAPTFAQVQATQIGILRAACAEAITAFVPVTLSSGTYELANGADDQRNSLMALATANEVIAKAKPWAAGAVAALNDIADVGGTLLLCVAAGTTGTVAPTPPTVYQSSVVDNTASWALFGLLIGLHPTGTMWLNAQEIIEAFTQGIGFVTDQRSKYAKLKAKVEAATTAAVKKVIW